MKKQKICIIGGGLTGLITAITLSKLNLSIDLITDNTNKIVKSNRTVAISQDNYDFLQKLNCPFYKVSSFEMTDLELIKCISKTKKPIP